MELDLNKIYKNPITGGWMSSRVAERFFEDRPQYRFGGVRITGGATQEEIIEHQRENTMLYLFTGSVWGEKEEVSYDFFEKPYGSGNIVKLKNFMKNYMNVGTKWTILNKESYPNVIEFGIESWKANEPYRIAKQMISSGELPRKSSVGGFGINLGTITPLILIIGGLAVAYFLFRKKRKRAKTTILRKTAGWEV